MSLTLILAVWISPAMAGSEIKPVCDRTPQVRAQLERVLNTPCDKITKEDLEDVDGLLLAKSGLTELKVGDFSGLPNVSLLDLSENQLYTDGTVIAELKNLRELRLDGMGVDSYQEGFFDQFPNLEVISLRDEALQYLPDFAFAKLKNIPNVSVLVGSRELSGRGSDAKFLTRTSKAAFWGVSVTGLPGTFAVDRKQDGTWRSRNF